MPASFSVSVYNFFCNYCALGLVKFYLVIFRRFVSHALFDLTGEENMFTSVCSIELLKDKTKTLLYMLNISYFLILKTTDKNKVFCSDMEIVVCGIFSMIRTCL